MLHNIYMRIVIKKQLLNKYTKLNIE